MIMQSCSLWERQHRHFFFLPNKHFISAFPGALAALFCQEKSLCWERPSSSFVNAYLLLWVTCCFYTSVLSQASSSYHYIAPDSPKCEHVITINKGSSYWQHILLRQWIVSDQTLIILTAGNAVECYLSVQCQG